MDTPSCPVPSNKTTNANSNNSRNSKKTTDTQLKGSIIEFMRDRPFLWNSKHPSYKDYKKREHEFQLFSKQIDCSVQEIKRVWHVLRTNFFRAHKLLLEKPQTGDGENGEKLWKYYLSMEYIIRDTDVGNDTPRSPEEGAPQPTRGLRGTPKVIQKGTKSHRELNNNNNNINNRTLEGGSSSYASTNSSIANSSCLNNSSTSNNNKSILLSDSSMDIDDDNLYARSLTSTLKKFDPTTKEIIKLKFQEIIVNYMRIQDQQHQQGNEHNHQSQKQTKQENTTPQDVS